MANESMICNDLSIEILKTDNGQVKEIRDDTFVITLQRVKENYEIYNLRDFVIRLLVDDPNLITLTRLASLLDLMDSIIDLNIVRVYVVISSTSHEKAFLDILANRKCTLEVLDLKVALDLQMNYDLSGLLLSVKIPIPLEISARDFYSKLKLGSFYEINLVYPIVSITSHTRSNENNEQYLGKWLVVLFDFWFNDTQRPKIDLFLQVVNLLLGNKVKSTLLGLGPVRELKIDTDGKILSNYPNSINDLQKYKSHLFIQELSLTTIYDKDIPLLIFNSKKNICGTCSYCTIGELCGGGDFISRYRLENDFDNVSFWCRDIILFISTAQTKVFSELSPEKRKDLSIDLISPQEIIDRLGLIQKEGISELIKIKCL